MPFQFEKANGEVVTLPTLQEDSSGQSQAHFCKLMREKYYRRVSGIDGLVPVELVDDPEAIEYWRERTAIRRRKLAYAAKTKQ